jgi:hypothetical protein
MRCRLIAGFSVAGFLSNTVSAAVIETSSDWLTIQPPREYRGPAARQCWGVFEAGNSGWNTNPNYDASAWVDAVEEGGCDPTCIWGQTIDTPTYF